jgi:hypothetical protein
MSLHIDTPLLESSAMTVRAGQSVWLKMDALQPSGSFKLRGIGHACEHYMRGGARRFISSSGGNAGVAAAATGPCPRPDRARGRHPGRAWRLVPGSERAGAVDGGRA